MSFRLIPDPIAFTEMEDVFVARIVCSGANWNIQYHLHLRQKIKKILIKREFALTLGTNNRILTIPFRI